MRQNRLYAANLDTNPEVVVNSSGLEKSLSMFEVASGARHSAGIANGQQMVQWTFAVSDSPWAELLSLLRSAGGRICQRW